MLILVWSEFGRRVADNASNGTDHGTANNIYLHRRSRSKAECMAADPNLTDLLQGNLKHTIDFRDVYATDHPGLVRKLSGGIGTSAWRQALTI